MIEDVIFGNVGFFECFDDDVFFEFFYVNEVEFGNGWVFLEYDNYYIFVDFDLDIFEEFCSEQCFD